MVISYNWLSDYLPQPVAVEELSRILTSIGLEVEALEPVEAIKGSLEGLVIGEVLTCTPHPDADKLKVTTVNVGGAEPLNIVCGAANVAAGQKVVVATIGTTVHPSNGEAFLIKKAKIRGVASEGMICAEDEIGLGASHEGIMVLPPEAVVGTLAKEYFNVPKADTAIHIGLTPNRSDAMSHIGVAKDVAAYLSYHKREKHSAKLPDTAVEAQGAPQIKVNIVNPEACPRYMGISVTGVTIAPSPEWLQLRLKAIGVRPISNIVDITNYVLHEFGQPLHAFDADKIKGQTVNVKFLPKGTKFITLDDKERTLDGEDLMICDAEDGMCIAGVFGGTHSGVTDGTKNIFIESAYFTPSYIRKTSLRHGLRTDAATHFEKGVDINNLPLALQRAAKLMVEIAGGKIASEITDVYPAKIECVTVAVTYDYIYRLAGKEYDKTAMKALLVSLGFELKDESAEGFTVVVPSNKTDVSQPADIVEEILRMDGLDNIAIPEKLNISLTKPAVSDWGHRNKVSDILCGLGFSEIVTNSIVNSKYYPEQDNLVKMLNSLTSELDVLRPSMLESGLEVMAYNCNRRNNNLALFEFGKVYATGEKGYAEQTQLALYVTGAVDAQAWNQQQKQADLYYVKGIVNNLLQYAGIKKLSTVYSDNKIDIQWKKQSLCVIQQVDSKRLSEFDVKQPVYYAYINWQVWLSAVAAGKVKYTEVPKHPAVQRDLAIIIDKQVSYGQVQTATDKLNIPSLQEYSLFDVFESDKLGEGKKSFALNYVFQLQDRTLTDAETDALMQQLMKSYKQELQAHIRE